MNILAHKKSSTGFLVFIFGIVPLLFSDATLDPNKHLQFLFLALILLAFFTYSYFQKNDTYPTNKSLIIYLTIFSLFITSSLLSTIYSYNFADGNFVLLKDILFFGLFIAILKMAKEEDFLSRISKIILLFSLPIFVLAVFQILSFLAENELMIPKSTYKIISIFAHRNLFVEYLVLSFPFFVFLILKKDKIWQILGFSASFLSIFFVLILSNRTAWICLILEILILFVFVYLNKKKIGKKLIINGLIIFFGSISIGFFTLKTFADKQSLEQHTKSTFDAQKGSTKDRLELWKRTKFIIEESPILGNGLETWKIELLKYGTKNLESENNETFYTRPHNDFLWVFAEQGIIGLVPYLALFGLFGFFLLKSIFDKNSPISTDEHFVLFAVLVSYLIIALLNFPKERIGHNIILFSMSAYLFSKNAPEKNIKLKIFNISHLILIIIFAYSAYFGYRRFESEIATKKAIAAKTESDFYTCLQEFENIDTEIYPLDETVTPVFWHRGLANFNLNNLEEAKNDFAKALESNPYHIYVLSDYSSVLSKTGDNKKAVQYLEIALEIAPNFTNAALNLCALHHKEKKYGEAFAALKKINVQENYAKYVTTRKVLINSNLIGFVNTKKIDTALYLKLSSETTFYAQFLKLSIDENLDFEQTLKKYLIHLEHNKK